jgi:hypothetical protein
MNNQEILEQIKQLNVLIERALNEAGNNPNINFYKSLIQQNAIDMYQKASALSTTTQTLHTDTKPHADIKIIRQEQILEKEAVPTVQPEIKEAVKAPVIEQPKQEQPVAPIHTAEIPERKTASITPPSIKPKTRTVEDNYEGEQELTLNDKISKNKQPVLNVAEKSKETPIKDLVKFISIGKKFEFINGLFDGNADVYKSTLNTVQNASSYEEATHFIESNIIGPYQWDNNETLAAEFFGLIKRRFIQQ